MEMEKYCFMFFSFGNSVVIPSFGLVMKMCLSAAVHPKNSQDKHMEWNARAGWIRQETKKKMHIGIVEGPKRRDVSDVSHWALESLELWGSQLVSGCKLWTVECPGETYTGIGWRREEVKG